MPRNSIRGWRVWAITRDLAEGKTQTSIARMYGVTQSMISVFARDHAAEVDEVRTQLEDAYAGLWAADKKKRIAAYQDVADEMNDAGRGDSDDGRAYISTVEARRAQMAALRSIADELGAIPQRVQVEGGTTPVRHVLEGVNTEDLG